MPNTQRRRRRDSTVELSRVGVGGVYWAFDSFPKLENNSSAEGDQVGF